MLVPRNGCRLLVDVSKTRLKEVKKETTGSISGEKMPAIRRKIGGKKRVSIPALSSYPPIETTHLENKVSGVQTPTFATLVY